MFRIRSPHSSRIIKTALSSSSVNGITSKTGSQLMTVQQTKRSFFSKSWLDSTLPWFNTPKGFGKYTKNRTGGAKESESNSSSSGSSNSSPKGENPSTGGNSHKTSGSGGSGGRGSGGSGGNRKPNGTPEPGSLVPAGLLLFGGIAITMLASDAKRGQ